MVKRFFPPSLAQVLWLQTRAGRMGASSSCCQSDEQQVQVQVISTHTGNGLEVQFAEQSDVQDVQSTPDPRSMSRARRSLLLKTAFFINDELLRGISIRESLRNAGSLWRISPSDLQQKDKAALRQCSAPVKGFDIFLSHTWRTHGFWKYLSLSFHYGWMHCMIGWLVTTMTVEFLFFLDILPSFWQSEAGSFSCHLVCTRVRAKASSGPFPGHNGNLPFRGLGLVSWKPRFAYSLLLGTLLARLSQGADLFFGRCQQPSKLCTANLSGCFKLV